MINKYTTITFLFILTSISFAVSQNIYRADSLDELPRFPGCEFLSSASARNSCVNERLNRFIGQYLIWPFKAKEMGIEGTIIVDFTVEIDGTITNVKIVQSIGGGCDEAVLKMMRYMPKWIPGKIEGKAVRSEYKLPIAFVLEWLLQPEKFKIKTSSEVDMTNESKAIEALLGRRKSAKKTMVEEVLKNPDAYAPPVLYALSNAFF